MKSKIINLFCAACVACAFTACNDDNNSDVIDDGIDGREEAVKDATIQFRISQNLPGTYASTIDESAVTGEIEPGSTIDIYIFDDWQVYEQHETLTLSQSGSYYTTPEFNVSSGNKYFYVFTNVPSGAISTPGNNTSRIAFEKNVINISNISSITTPGQFFMGTLYGKVTPVNGTGTPGTPEVVDLQIGRLSAKVVVADDKPNVAGNLAGDFRFDEGEFRIINTANQYYTVGQWDNGFRTHGSQVTTPFYNSIDATLSNVSSYIVAPSATWNGISVGSPAYTVENTSSNPRKGTATAVQIMYPYEPDGSEVYDVATNQNNASLPSDGTFWVAVMNDSSKVMYNADPTSRPDVARATKYDEGKTYYIVYLADDTETASPSLTYAVIRNHYYNVKVNNVARLGNGDPDTIIDPVDPIDKEDAIQVRIEILPWFYISQQVDL